MVQESVFRGMISFLNQIGVYDIILPFILVFTIVFAILEKTRIFGIDPETKTTKKNINSMVAFSIAFLVIASTRLVSIINEVFANMVLLLVLSVSFLILAGSVFGDEEFSLKNFPGWSLTFMIIMFGGIVLIFLNALGWLQTLFDLFKNWRAEWASSIIFMIITIAFIIFITWSPSKSKGSSGSGGSESS